MNLAHLEEQGRAVVTSAFLGRQPSWVSGQISPADSVFLSGLAQVARPRNAVEIGVASGWSSVVLLRSLNRVWNDDFVLNAIDLSPTYYLDASIPTGRVVTELVPELASSYRLLTGKLACEVTPTLGQTDFAFIDANHLHPWTTLDLLAVLPFIARNSWIAFHDLNLCRFPRHKHRNRGPFYLFHAWSDTRLASSEAMPMIGAVLLEQSLDTYLALAFEVLCTPWETPVDQPALDATGKLLASQFGEAAGRQFRDACETGRPK